MELERSSDFYWRMGMRASSIADLQDSMLKGKGRISLYLWSQSRRARGELNRVASAIAVLKKLGAEDPLNTEVFHELARLYVRTMTPLLYRILRVTLAAVRKTGHRHQGT